MGKETVEERNIRNSVVVTLTREELRIIHQALNEICNGIDLSDAEFTIRMGTERVEVQMLLTDLGTLYDNLGAAGNERV
jgi:hypothetical protein